MSTETNNKQTEQTAQQTSEQTMAIEKAKESFTPQLCTATINKIKSDPALAPLHGIANTLAKPFESFRKAFKDPSEADRVMAKEIDFAAQAMMANTYLITVANKNPLSLVNALKNIALTGSTLNPVLKQAYLVPFTISGNPTITLMPSYMGLIDVLVNNGLVRKVEAHCVFKGDEFKITHGSESKLIHNPDPWAERTENTMLGAYYFVVMTDGTEMFDHMSKPEIDVIKSRSPSTGLDKNGQPKKSPWLTDYCEMAKKTLVRRAFKMIPKSGISEDKVRAIEAVFDYDEKIEQNWIAEQKQPVTKCNGFDEDEVEYEEIKE